MGTYFPPSIGPAGLSVPSYTEILQDNINQFLSIYGQNQYLGIDSPVYQLLSIISLKQADANAGLQLIFNQLSPLTAVGTGLDRVVKLNGIARLPFTFSTAQLTVTGAQGTVISNGFAQDVNGNQWALPATLTIPGTGSITVFATCTTPGNVYASAGSINTIATPTAGWLTVNNPSAATPGQPVETDSALRARQSISVSLPSKTMLSGTVAAIAAIAGVTRYHVYENYLGYSASTGTCNVSGTTVTILSGYPLDSTDDGQSITINGVAYSISSASGASATLTASAPTLTGANYFIGDGYAMGPGHSVTAVVEGGASSAIATAIYNNRGIGALANGTTSVPVADPSTGYVTNIGFYLPAYLPVFVSISVHGLSGFTSATLAAIQSDVSAYLNSLQIGESVIYSELYGAALNARSNPDVPAFSIRQINSGTSASAMFGVILGSSGGTGYQVGDVLTVTQSGGSGGTVTVSAIGGGGIVDEISPVATAGGTGYAVASNLATTGGHGSGAEVTIQSVAPSGSSDISIEFNQVAQGVLTNVAVVSV